LGNFLSVSAYSLNADAVTDGRSIVRSRYTGEVRSLESTTERNKHAYLMYKQDEYPEFL
jgi:hypothetical protein